MSAVTLSSATRSILLSLQSAATQTDSIQNRLSTGKRVNSALDDPVSYFTAQSFLHRAGDLNARIDQMTQARQTLAAANNGIVSITRLVTSAQTVAAQARRAPLMQTSYDTITHTGAAVSGETIGAVTGGVDTRGGFTANIDGLAIQTGGQTFTVHAPGASSIGAIVTAINGTAGLGPSGAVRASLDDSGTYIKLTASGSDVSFNVVSNAASSALGIAGQTGTSTNLLQALGGLDGTSLTVRTNGGAATTVNFGTGGGQVSTFQELQNALGGSGIDVTRTTGGALQFAVAGTSGRRNSLAESGSAVSALGLPGGTDYGAVLAPVPEPTRAAAQAQYNTLLTQISQVAADSGFSGLNLLTGGTLNVAVNEAGTSQVIVSGASLTAAGLGLTAASGDDFQANPVIDSALSALTAALGKLRTQAVSFGAALSTLTTRQDFTTQMIATLQGASDDLTLADTNAEGANLLAVQTRQALSLTALSLSSQSERSVLTMLR